MDAITRGFQNCTLAIFAKAINDSHLPGLYGNSARLFLAPSPWAGHLAELMGLDPECAKEIARMMYGDRQEKVGVLVNG